jgi:hypothetical protein
MRELVSNISTLHKSAPPRPLRTNVMRLIQVSIKSEISNTVTLPINNGILFHHWDILWYSRLVPSDPSISSTSKESEALSFSLFFNAAADAALLYLRYLFKLPSIEDTPALDLSRFSRLILFLGNFALDALKVF